MKKVRSGFTLLEVMVAVAIVALSMGVIIEIESQAIAKTSDAKAFTIATLLARGKMLDVQQTLSEEGYGDFMKVLDGDFSEEGFADFRWIARVRKVEVPTPPIGSGMNTSGAAAGATSTGGAGPSMGLGMLAPMMQNVGKILENSVREIELRVLWKDGKYDRNIRIVTHVIDKQGLANGMQNSGIPGMSGMPGMSGGGLPGLQGASRPGGSMRRPQGAMSRPSRLNNMRPGAGMRPSRGLSK